MSEQLLAVLRLCLLGLIYLFFLRVLRAVWVEVHGPRRVRAAVPVAAVPVVAVPVAAGTPAPTFARPPSALPALPALPGAALRITEPASLAGRSFALVDEATIGRAAGCLVQLDDTYVSQVHARVARGVTGYTVEDLNSTNGTYVNRVKVTVPTPLYAGDRLQVGNIVLELT